MELGKRKAGADVKSHQAHSSYTHLVQLLHSVTVLGRSKDGEVNKLHVTAHDASWDS